jgi:signal transduction histidine kinase
VDGAEGRNPGAAGSWKQEGTLPRLFFVTSGRTDSFYAPDMTDRAAAALLWLTAAFVAAALLATVTPWLAEWAWPWRCGCQLCMLGATGGPVLLVLRAQRASPAPTDQPPLAGFLSGANHELNTPLTGIKAYVELLADGDADDEATREEFLNGISSQAERLERTIDELLKLVRVGSDPRPERACPTSPSNGR